MPKRTKSKVSLPRPLPRSLTDAAGMLKGRGIDPLRYQRKIRKQWEERFKKQMALGLRERAARPSPASCR